MGNSLLAVRKINHKTIVVGNEVSYGTKKPETKLRFPAVEKTPVRTQKATCVFVDRKEKPR